MPTPLQELSALYQSAIAQQDPCAHYVTFITVDEDGLPASRIITLRRLDEQGVELLVNAASPKVRHWQANGKWELSGFWPSLMVQFRLRGQARLQQDEVVARDWQGKRKASQLSDLYHHHVRQQSAALPSRPTLLAELAELEQRLGGRFEMPPAVSFLVLQPDMVEIGRASVADRLHDRRRYHRQPQGWTEALLVP